MRDGNCSELMIDESEIATLLSVSNRRNQEQAPPEFHNIGCQFFISHKEVIYIRQSEEKVLSNY